MAHCETNLSLGYPVMAVNYWLFKSEPDAFSIDDLFAMPNATDHWDGIRNYQARNLMRDEMKKGDKGFFYHSSCKVPGVVGEVKIVSTAYDDLSAQDPSSKYFDPKASAENPRWCMLDVQATKQYREVIPLTALKACDELAGMTLLKRGNRLSIMPVTREEWGFIRKMSR